MHELDLISKIRQKEKIKDKSVIVGIGDDAAVIDRGKVYELVTSDMLIEGDHFRLDWATPQQIGKKAMEVNLSDIAAMGGVPKYTFVSLCLSKKVDAKWAFTVYKGMKKASCEVPILGGDITHGDKVAINVALIGEVEKDRCCFRSGARLKDVICVTGDIGGSTAGLSILGRRGGSRLAPTTEYCVRKHLEPTAKIKEGRILSKYVNSMIDISDGLGSEISHICKESRVGARVYSDKVPINIQVKKTAQLLEGDPLKWAMSGGEDFELLFTISPKKLADLRCEHTDFECFEVGEIISRKKGVKFVLSGEEKEMPGGYEHF